MEAERNRRLLAWYDFNRRPLPWRQTRDPWAILVSEVMSQQTQISRVVPRWQAFMDRYPDPNALADSDRAELIRMWQGLGYQRRAVNLQRAAQHIAREGWPHTADGLRSLPGVGPYTAAAVACFAFGEQVATVDTNLRRILSRWEGRPLHGADLSQVASTRLDRDRPADWNQALMDLGATTCRPRRPRCGECPVAEDCVDPGISQPPVRQSPYEGSVRQARAAILRHVAEHGPTPIVEIVGLEPATVAMAAEALAAEGLVETSGGSIALSRARGSS